MHQRGYLILHASAVLIQGKVVAFVGDKGWGKSNLGANFNHGLPLRREKIDRVMQEDLKYIGDYLDLKILRSLYQRFQGENMSHTDYVALWKSLSLTLWLKRTKLSP